MKFILLTLFLFLALFAGNMSLGPYNDKGFKTVKEKELEAEKKLQAKKELERLQLKRFEKRQVELKEKRRLERESRIQKRLEIERIEKEKIVAEEIRMLTLARAKEKEEFKKQEILEKKKALDLAKSSENNESSDYKLSLTPEQADISSLNPDDIETELANIDRLRFLLLHSAGTPEYIKDYIRMLNDLEKNYNISVAFSYRTIAQYELDSSTYGGGGKFDASIRWKATEETQFAARVEGRHKIGKYSSSEFKNEFGALTSTSASYRKEDPYLSQFWLHQQFGNFVFRLGKIDSSSYIDSHLFKSSSRFFFNGTFSASPYNSYPANGLGLAGRYIQPRYYITAEVTDANAIRDEVDDTFFSEKEYYKAVEFGITPEDGSKYHITAWQRDESNVTRESKGMILSFVQALDNNTHLIVRGAFSDYAKAKRYFSLGLGRMSIFQEHDMSGLAIGTLVPSDELKRTQTSIESFYRVDPMPGVQLSADMQLIYHPSDSEQNWAVVPGLRLRILF